MTITTQFTLAGSGQRARKLSNAPFRMLLLADCLGDQPPGESTAERRPLRLDLDRFDGVLARLCPTLDLDDHGRLAFRALDDFHPDALCHRSPVLRRLHETYRALGDPKQAEKLIGGDDPQSSQETGEEDAPASDLERLLGGKVEVGSDRKPGNDPLTRYLAGVVSPHLVDSKGAEPYLQATRLSLSEQLQQLLHDPRFLALDACWQGLWWLVSQLPVQEIEIFLLPLTRSELQSFYAQVEEPSAPEESPCLPGQVDDEGDWSVIATLFDFAASREDIDVLSALAHAAAARGSALVAGADPALAGCDRVEALGSPSEWKPLDAEVEDGWQALRQSDAAPWVALGIPRLLMRAPYDPRQNPVDSFEFTEDAGEPENRAWASGALGLAAALGIQFQFEEWDMDAGSGVELEDLPSFTFDEFGEPRLQSAVETVIGEQGMQALARQGLTPLIGSRNRIDVVLPGCVSLAGKSLRGGWNG